MVEPKNVVHEFKNDIYLELIRKYKKKNYTIGKLYINNVYFCDTLEDTDRGLNNEMSLDQIKSKKIKGQTAIPSGTYEVIVSYSPKFKRFLPLIVDVPGYSGIRIHPGNTHADTEGCILVGENKVVGKVLNSKVTFNLLYEQLKRASDNKRKIQITIKQC